MANHTFFSISTTYKWDHKIGWNAFTMYLYIVQRNRICPTSFIWQDDRVSKFALKLKITWLTIILVFPNKNVRYIWTSQILRQTQIFWLLSPNCHAFCPNNIFSYQTHRCIGDLIYPIRYHYPHIWWWSLPCGWFIPHLLMVKHVHHFAGTLWYFHIAT